jgi:hypothetical protein
VISEILTLSNDSQSVHSGTTETADTTTSRALAPSRIDVKLGEWRERLSEELVAASLPSSTAFTCVVLLVNFLTVLRQKGIYDHVDTLLFTNFLYVHVLGSKACSSMLNGKLGTVLNMPLMGYDSNSISQTIDWISQEASMVIRLQHEEDVKDSEGAGSVNVAHSAIAPASEMINPTNDESSPDRLLTRNKAQKKPSQRKGVYESEQRATSIQKRKQFYELIQSNEISEIFAAKARKDDKEWK